MSSTDNIRTKEDFKVVFGRSPIKKGQQLELDNDELDDENTQISNQIHKEENQVYYDNLATNAKRRLLLNDYNKLLETPGLRDKLQDIPLNSLTNHLPNHLPNVIVVVVNEHVFLEKGQPKDDPVSHRDVIHVNTSNQSVDTYLLSICIYNNA